MKRLLIAAVAMALMTTGAWAVIIDHFEDPPGTNTIFNIDPAVAGTYNATQGPVLTDVVGAQRDFELVITTGDAVSSTVVVQFSNEPVPGGTHFLNYENGPNVVSTLELTYGLGGPLGLDLSGDSGFVFDLLVADFGGSADVTLVDNLANSWTVNVPFPSTASAMAVSTPLSDFSSNGVDLANVDLISVKLIGPANWDVRLDAIETTQIPEPATLLLLGLAGVPFIRRLRRS